MPDDTPSRGTVLLTGATGFVGRRLQTLLLDNDYAVRALIRHQSPRSENIDPRAERIEGALDDPQALARGLVGTKAVINCAGAVRGNSPDDFADVNIDGVRALAKAVERLSAPPALLHMSSLAASHPELSDYADSKKSGEKVLDEFPELLWTVFRPPAIYGPGDVEMRPLLIWCVVVLSWCRVVTASSDCRCCMSMIWRAQYSPGCRHPPAIDNIVSR